MEKPDHSHKSWIERLGDALLREPQDREQLLNLLEDAHERDLLSHDALGMIEGVLQVSEMQVRDVMVPRSQMVTVEHDMHVQDALPRLVDSAHSRYPVIDLSQDEIIGILLAKDLLPYAVNQDQTVTVADIMRPAKFIPEAKRLDILLQEFRQDRNHIAMVLDEYGGIAGMATIEDVLEQIVGDIADEYDDEEQEANIKPLGNEAFLVDALTPISEVNEQFQLDLPDEPFDTIGGWVASQFGHVPQEGEILSLSEQVKAEVVEATDRQILLLKLVSN